MKVTVLLGLSDEDFRKYFYLLMKTDTVEEYFLSLVVDGEELVLGFLVKDFLLGMRPQF